MKRASNTPQEPHIQPSERPAEQKAVSSNRSQLARSLRGLSTAALLTMAACAPDPQKPNSEVDTTPPRVPVLMAGGPIMVQPDATEGEVPVSIDPEDTARLQYSELGSDDKPTTWHDVPNLVEGKQNQNARVPAPSRTVYRAADAAGNYSPHTAGVAEVIQLPEIADAPQLLGVTHHMLPSTATTFNQEVKLPVNARTLNVYRGTEVVLTQAVSGGETLTLAVPHLAGTTQTYTFEALSADNQGHSAEAVVEAAEAPTVSNLNIDCSIDSGCGIGGVYPVNIKFANAVTYSIRAETAAEGNANGGWVTGVTFDQPAGDVVNNEVTTNVNLGTDGASPVVINFIIEAYNALGEEIEFVQPIQAIH